MQTPSYMASGPSGDIVIDCWMNRSWIEVSWTGVAKTFITVRYSADRNLHGQRSELKLVVEVIEL